MWKSGRLIRLLVVMLCSSLVMWLSLALVQTHQFAVVRSAPQRTITSVSGQGFIFRSSPTTITPFEVFTLPTITDQFRQPHSLVALTYPVTKEIWYTDPGADRVGQLIYTTTNDYAFKEVTLAAGSEPFDLVLNEGNIWFTARKGDWIGQIEIGTQAVFSYPVPSGSQPWSIDVGSDDSIWFTERGAGKIGRLIVTDTANFSLIEYALPQAGSQAEGLAVEHQSGADRVWVGQTVPNGQNRLIRLNLAQPPPNNFQSLGPLSEPSYPKNLAVGNDIWFTEVAGNKISKVFLSTLAFYDRETIPTSGSQPYDLLVAPGEIIWFSEMAGQKVGRLMAVGAGTQITEYPVAPQLGRLWLQGIARGSDNRLWLTGFAPYQNQLPIIFKTPS